LVAGHFNSTNVQFVFSVVEAEFHLYAFAQWTCWSAPAIQVLLEAYRWKRSSQGPQLRCCRRLQGRFLDHTCLLESFAPIKEEFAELILGCKHLGVIFGWSECLSIFDSPCCRLQLWQMFVHHFFHQHLYHQAARNFLCHSNYCTIAEDVNSSKCFCLKSLIWALKSIHSSSSSASQSSQGCLSLRSQEADWETLHQCSTDEDLAQLVACSLLPWRSPNQCLGAKDDAWSLGLTGIGYLGPFGGVSLADSQ